MIRVGLVAALWAAAIGTLAATRYRRESAVDKAKVNDLQKVYQLQLEREVAARREYELGVETRVRREVGANAEEMAALRAELAILRENLHRLFDGDLLEDRPALRAEAVRVQELPARPPPPPTAIPRTITGRKPNTGIRGPPPMKTSRTCTPASPPSSTPTTPNPRSSPPPSTIR